MNKGGNARAEATKQKINRALFYLLTHKSFNEIFVKDICTIACINRSSFYEHYQDINDLMMKTEANLSKQIETFFSNAQIFNRDCFVKMFSFIKDNKEFYLAYLTNNCGSLMGQTDFVKYHSKFKNTFVARNYAKNEVVYHMAFFSAGLNALCKVWLMTGLKETPEQMAEILYDEYSTKTDLFSKE